MKEKIALIPMWIMAIVMTYITGNVGFYNAWIWLLFPAFPTLIILYIFIIEKIKPLKDR